MSDLKQKDYDDIKGWQKHLRRTAQDENLSKSTRRKINYRIGLMDRLINRVDELRVENERLRVALAQIAYGLPEPQSLGKCRKIARTALETDESTVPADPESGPD